MNTLAFYEFSSGELWLVAGIALIYPLLVIYCLVDIVRSDFKDSTTKLIWVLIVLSRLSLGRLPISLLAGKARQ
jgi:hypothetical protein